MTGVEDSHSRIPGDGAQDQCRQIGKNRLLTAGISTELRDDSGDDAQQRCNVGYSLRSILLSWSRIARWYSVCMVVA